MMSENHMIDGEIISSDAADDGKVPPLTYKSEQLKINCKRNLRNSASESSDDESTLILKTKKRVHRFSESDSDVSKENHESFDNQVSSSSHLQENIDNEKSLCIFKSSSNKSRIRKMSLSDEEASDTEKETSKNIEQQLRMRNKNQKLRNKFEKLINSREQDNDRKVDTGTIKENSNEEDEPNSSEDEMSSIDKIKEKIKKRTTSLKMSICDPDTSDEESNQNKRVYKAKKEQRRTKLTSPKPQKMTAKQAMENMQKIKSESNRMLREKEVSLPYHRPKALSLQDIMKRRRPAVSCDGKALPIKMNNDQLKHYALSLEQRQKEMIELCKSDTEEDEQEEVIENLEDKVPDISISNNDKSEINNGNPLMESKEILIDNEKPIKNELSTIDAESLQLNISNSDKNISPENNINNAGEDMNNKSGDVSAEMELVYNDSSNLHNVKNRLIDKIGDAKNEDEKESLVSYNINCPSIQISKEMPVNDITLENCCNNKEQIIAEANTEMESQLITLRYLDSENTVTNNTEANHKLLENVSNRDIIETTNSVASSQKVVEEVEMTDFTDEDMNIDDINMDEIDSVIENAEIIKDTCDDVNSPAIVRDIPVLSVNPKLTGAPGMVIDLDGTDPIAPKKLSGVELLKERFKFFAKLKTPEEMEREREKRQKPGTLHLKLKHELEEKIAEQRSLEWSKRLDNEKQNQKELNSIRGEKSESEDDIDKLESKLSKDEGDEKETSLESEEEPLEDDVFLEDKPKKRNPLVDDEAAESDIDETPQDKIDNKETSDHNVIDDGVEGDDESDAENIEEDSSEEESSESEDEIEPNKSKKGRILKAFEDSDDEEAPKFSCKVDDTTSAVKNDTNDIVNFDKPLTLQSQSDVFTDSQDDVLQLAQVQKQISGELFTSPDCVDNKSQTNVNSTKDDELQVTQTFSILNTNNTIADLDLQNGSDKLTVISETQTCDDNLDAVVGMCSGSFSQNCVPFQPPTTQSQLSQSQPIGEDLLNMCTGNFYDNQFVTPLEENDKLDTSDDISQDPTPCLPKTDEIIEKGKNQDEDILKSVLDELNEPEIESPKQLKFFFDGKNQNKENEQNVTNTQHKKRFIIDSDEETKDNPDSNSDLKKKKLKKKKLKDRALQISDDEEEEEEYSELEGDEYLSDRENEEEKLVEYDSEENEVEVKPQVVKKKKKKASEFFEQEAELTSEDEWVGSGDEDEAGLDRMEREEGDDDTFHQGRLQRELGQIHMRDVLDQDKREVRLIQELLFEDGDLGAGGRQRKFRWRNADGEEATGTVPDEFADTQEEEFESEEQWRKQRHEREMFLRQMKNEGKTEKEEDLNVSVNRSTIIKANLASRTMSSLLEEVNQTKTEVATTSAVPEKKPKDIPSPKKPFLVLQQNYHGSLLTRGRGALARLAALATPLVADDDASKVLRGPTSNRNFVFATITPEDTEPKVTKRKAESNNAGTPRLVKKMRTDEKQKLAKSSLLDHLKA